MYTVHVFTVLHHISTLKPNRVCIHVHCKCVYITPPLEATEGICSVYMYMHDIVYTCTCIIVCVFTDVRYDGIVLLPCPCMS